jgi:hypothetical protein
MRRRSNGAGEQRVLVVAPLYHMNALAVSQAALAQHDTIILLPGFTARSYIEAAAKYRATTLTSVPTMIGMILREKALTTGADLTAFTAVRMGSAPVSHGLMEAARRNFPNAMITNSHGTTEAGPIVPTVHPDSRPTPDLSGGITHSLDLTRVDVFTAADEHVVGAADEIIEAVGIAAEHVASDVEAVRGQCLRRRERRCGSTIRPRQRRALLASAAGMVRIGDAAGRHQQDRPAGAGKARRRAAESVVNGCRRYRAFFETAASQLPQDEVCS